MLLPRGGWEKPVCLLMHTFAYITFFFFFLSEALVFLPLSRLLDISLVFGTSSEETL